MRIACSTFSFHKDFSEQKVNILGFLARCSEAGIDAVELNDGYLAADAATPAEIKSASVRLGLDVCALAIETVVYVSDDCGVAAYRDRMLGWLETCDRLGAPILRVNTAQPGDGMHDVRPGVSEGQVRTWAVEAYRDVARAAQNRGITIAVENHYGLTRTSADTLGFIAAIGASNVGVNADTGNFWESPHQVRDSLGQDGPSAGLVPFENPYEGIARLAPHMVFSHCKIYGLTPDGVSDKALDYARILDIFRDHDYKGYLSIENFTHDDPFSVVTRSANMLRAHVRGY